MSLKWILLLYTPSRLAQCDTEQFTPATSRPDELGALARAFEVFRDNARTVRRMASDMLEQTNLLATVVESMKDGLSVFDRDGRLVTWNRQYPVLLHLNSDAVVHGMTLGPVSYTNLLTLSLGNLPFMMS